MDGAIGRSAMVQWFVRYDVNVKETGQDDMRSRGVVIFSRTIYIHQLDSHRCVQNEL